METSPAAKDILKSPCKKEKNFVFKRPLDAPVFHPTEKEFEDPLKYISEISKEGLSYGIVKIIPPEGWKPPFALNYDNFKFKPRIQKINELEATTRIKLHFLSKVLKAVARDGKVPKVPYVEKTLLDLHQLYYKVRKEGGLDMVNKRKKWNDIATEMGYCGKTSSQILRQHYETYVIPYLEELKGEIVNKEETETDEELIKLTNIRELKSLEFLGPGPKMPTCNYNFSSSMKTRTRHKKVQYEFDPLAKYMCQVCGRDDSEGGTLANCKTCFDKYHLVCLSPPLTDMPKEWLCPKCLVACDPNNPFENFGFETAEREYTLRQFGHMADKYKHNHFKVIGRLVPLDKCEEEYWRLMGSMDSSVTVEYGADLSTMDVGSGFPTEQNLNLDGVSMAVAKEYAESKWNLNNLSVLRESALRHITSNISGMKVPWVYVGMCFSTFCWHNEDHWSYSINYLHWGEPKTWYGVSGLEADKFEREIKALVPELFEKNSNILHELVTNMNPNLLMEKGVPIFRTDQKEGEFVVTFPRAYHAGFNQGFNFAEACNFAPADWIHMGRKSVIYYGHFKRNCVFSHDELICKIAENPYDVDKDICIAAFNDMREMIFTEMNRRSFVKNISGIKKSERFDFSFVKDEERQCTHCKTTCYLSAVYCACSTSSVICLDHINNHCNCDPSKKVLRYQFTFSELVELLLKFIDVLDDFDTSMNLILAMYEYREAKPFTLCKLLQQASKKQSPLCSEYLKDFKKHVALTLRCCIISRFLVQSLVVRKDIKENLSFSSLNFFFKCLKSLPWNIPELKSFENLVNSIDKFQNYLSVLLDNDKLPKSHLRACLNVINLLNVSFHEVPLLEQKLKELESTEDFDRTNGNEFGFTSQVDIENDKEQEGVDNVKGINNLLKKVTEWNKKVKLLFDCNDKKIDYKYLNDLISDGKQLKIESSYMNKLCCLSEEVKQWLHKCERLLCGAETIYLHEINEFICNGKILPVVIERIIDFESEYNKIKDWLDGLRLLYCLDDSTESVLQVLWPRKFKPRVTYFGMRSTEEPLLDSSTFPEDFSEETLIVSFEEEFKSLMALRWENAQKKSLPYKNEKIKCPCGMDIGEIYLCCELCQTMFHNACFPQASHFNKHFALLPYKNLYCSYCIRTKRPPLTKLIAYLKTADDIKLKLPEYYILQSNVNMWVALQRKVDFFLDLRDVNCAFQKTLSHSPKHLYDVPLVQLHDKRILVLRFLLQQTDVVEVNMSSLVNLWALFEATKCDLANRRKISVHDSDTPRKNSSSCELEFDNGKKITEKRKMTRKRKNSMHQNKPLDTGPKRVKTANSRKKAEGASEELPASLLERFTVDQLRAYLNEEMCAALTCVKPSEDEVHWVQCDGKCRLWFHMKCVNVGLDEVKDDDDYICLKCLFIDEKNNAANDTNQPYSGL